MDARPLNILALEPYYGGSHRAFLDGWRRHSRHRWTVLTLPARKWTWRMRTAADAFALQAGDLLGDAPAWDVIWCSGMLDLATFRGLAPAPAAHLPAVVIFHENQLTYPHQDEARRDYTYGLINIHTAMASSRAWFSSRFHLDAFLRAAEALLRRVPDHDPEPSLARIRDRADLQAPGIELPAAPVRRAPGPLRIVWAARWEHDKNPETLFEALHLLAERGTDFTVDVLGEQFRDAPPVFAEARPRLGNRVRRWGYVDRQEYETALGEADVFVSTAHHEFFGLSAVEAAAAGAGPLLPRRLAYPEVFQADRHPAFFYDGSARDLAERLSRMATELTAERPRPAVDLARRFAWPQRAAAMDRALEALAVSAPWPKACNSVAQAEGLPHASMRPQRKHV